jgi:hypothetical protein
LFIFTIGLTLWLLADPNHKTMVRFALTLSILCLCLLLPFFYFLKQRLDPKWWMSEWARQIILKSKKRNSNDWWGTMVHWESEPVPRELLSLLVMVERAADSHEIEIFGSVMDTLVSILYDMTTEDETNTMFVSTRLSDYIVERISDIGRRHDTDAVIRPTIVDTLIGAAQSGAIGSEWLLAELDYYFAKTLEQKASDSLLEFYVEELASALGWQLAFDKQWPVPGSVDLLRKWASSAATQKYTSAPRHVVRCFVKWGTHPAILEIDTPFHTLVASALNRLAMEVKDIDSQLASYALAALWHIGASNLYWSNLNRSNKFAMFVDELRKAKANVTNSLFLSGLEQAKTGHGFPENSQEQVAGLLNQLIQKVNTW